MGTIRFAIAWVLIAWAVPAAYCAQRAPQLQPEAINDVNLAPALAKGANGGAVLRAQILLDRARFSVGEIDGAFGSNMARAVAAFRKSQGLEPSAVLDAPTWEALNREGAMALTAYRITDADVA